MKYCHNCGAQLSSNSFFCSFCGTSVESTGANPIHNTISSPELTRGLIDYLHRVLDLEKSLFAQRQTIKELSNHIQTLGIPNPPQKPTYPTNYKSASLDGIWSGFIFGSIIIGLILAFTLNIPFGICVILGGFIGAFVVVCFNISNENKVNKERYENYQSEMEQYHKNIKADENRVTKELAEKNALIPVLKTMIHHLRETENVLKTYYSPNIIYEKYRNLVALCSICEYFDAHRCNSLGAAYTLFENEARLDRILTKLDEVIKQLEEIKESQYMLYSAIQEGNRIAERMVQESIKQTKFSKMSATHSALTAHYAEISARNAEFSAWIQAANYLETHYGNH